jgi:hypothetical protein
VFRCGEWSHTISGPIQVKSHNQRSNSFSIICNAGWIMDMWRFCRPIGSDCCWNQWTSTDCSKSWRYYYPPWANIVHICIKKSSNVRVNKIPRSRHAGNPSERNMDHPMHSKMYMIDSDPIESYTLTCKMPRSDKLPPTFNQRHAAWVINLQTGRLASGVSVVHHKPCTGMRTKGEWWSKFCYLYGLTTKN